MNAIRQRLRRLRRGFTLVEVSLALLVLSVGVLTAYALFPEGLNAGRAATSGPDEARPAVARMDPGFVLDLE